MSSKLTAEEARRLLSYEPATGLLRWKVERRRKHAGDVAGCVARNKKGYRWVTVGVNYESHKAHRIIWLIVKGVWPSCEIDHKDNDPTNNKWNNLREATHSQNGKNIKLKKNNTSGVAGVSIDKRRGLYRARIWVNFKEKWIGYYPTLEAAKIARNVAAKKYHGDFGKIQ